MDAQPRPTVGCEPQIGDTDEPHPHHLPGRGRSDPDLLDHREGRRRAGRRDPEEGEEGQEEQEGGRREEGREEGRVTPSRVGGAGGQTATRLDRRPDSFFRISHSLIVPSRDRRYVDAWLFVYLDSRVCFF